MRPVKFRVWDKHYERWEERLCAITNMGSLIVYNPNTQSWFEPSHTGYKILWLVGQDMNSREIYEDSLVNLRGHKSRPYTGKFPTKCKVVWFDEGSCWMLDCLDGKHSFGLYKNSLFEIIGE